MDTIAKEIITISTPIYYSTPASAPVPDLHYSQPLEVGIISYFPCLGLSFPSVKWALLLSSLSRGVMMKIK